MYKRFILLSPMYGADEHLMFELGLISIIFSKYPNAYIEFVGNYKHCEQLKEYSYFSEKIFFSKIPFNSRRILVFLSCIYVLFKKGDLIVLSAERLVYILLFFKKIFLFFPHTFYAEQNSFFKRTLHFFIFKMFLFSHRSTFFVFLGEWIYFAIISDKNFSKMEKSNFKWINHPFTEYGIIRQHLDKVFLGKIFFGLLGKISPQKGFTIDEMEYVANEIVTQGGYVVKTSQDDFVGIQDYCSRLQLSDYVILISGKDAYKFRCSGLFIEAIMNNKPIICIRNPMTSYFFSQYGNIGYICDDLEHLKDAIKYIIVDGHKRNYLQQIENLKRIKIN